MMTKTAGAWFQNTHAGRRAELKMFCFPYAGGTASVYRNWAGLLAPTVQVIPVELPGRGSLLRELPFVSMPALIEALAEVIIPLLDKPFAFFGHSMGAVIAFELARHLHREYDRRPQALFPSGRRAPQIPDTGPITYDLPKDEFVEELRRIGGTPKEVLEHVELLEIMIPLLRADFQLIQTYEYIACAPLQCPIIACGGLDDDEETCDLLSGWKEQTSFRFKLQMLAGDHFFLQSNETLLLKLLARELSEVIACSHQNDPQA
jgi:medium-chain acyl-[acyl-carrier-protein] hydrolase